MRNVEAEKRLEKTLVKPQIDYLSSSVADNSPYIFERLGFKSKRREAVTASSYSESAYEDMVSAYAELTGSNIEREISSLLYLNLPIESKESRKYEIEKVSPTIDLTESIFKKSLVTKSLFPCYTKYSPINGITNYSSISLKRECIVWANLTGSYDIGNDWTTSFWIKPKPASAVFTPQTLFHISGSVQIAITSGSAKNRLGYPQNFSVSLALSSSADLKPQDFSASDFVLTSSHTVNDNQWSLVKCSFSSERGNLVQIAIFNETEDNVHEKHILSSSVCESRRSFVALGAFCESYDSILSSQYNDTGYDAISTGSLTLSSGSYYTNRSTCEIHDIRIYKKFLSENEDLFSTPNVDDLRFYCPVFYIPEEKSGLYPQINNQPKMLGSEWFPFYRKNAGNYLTLLMRPEAFLQDVVHAVSPRILGLEFMTGSIEQENTRRNSFILPCDNGLYSPNFIKINSCLDTLSNHSVFFSLGSKREDMIVLENMTSGSLINIAATTGSLFDTIVSEMSSMYYQNTRDASSNMWVLLSIPHLMYSQKISPGSFIANAQVDGETLTLRDNGRGQIYRGDCKTKHYSNCDIGNIFYEEGIVFLKHPALCRFFDSKIDVSFSGHHEINTLIVDVPVEKGHFLSSSNPTYVLQRSDDVTLRDRSQLHMITGVALHDENFNIVMKTCFAQALPKNEDDSFIIRVKMDY